MARIISQLAIIQSGKEAKARSETCMCQDSKLKHTSKQCYRKWIKITSITDKITWTFLRLIKKVHILKSS